MIVNNKKQAWLNIIGDVLKGVMGGIIGVISLIILESVFMVIDPILKIFNLVKFRK